MSHQGCVGTGIHLEQEAFVAVVRNPVEQEILDAGGSHLRDGLVASRTVCCRVVTGMWPTVSVTRFVDNPRKRGQGYRRGNLGVPFAGEHDVYRPGTAQTGMRVAG